MTPERIEIFNTPVDCVDMQQVLNLVDDSLQTGHKRLIFAVNPEKVIRCEQDNELLDYLKAADVLIPDGIGLVIASKILRSKTMGRVPGADLMPKICELSQKQKNGIFFFGAREEINKRAADVIKKLYPGVNIAGRRNGYVKPAEMNLLVEEINNSGAEILFVALGSPTQEKWISEHIDQLTNIKIIQGVGGTFDAITGNVKRAPKVFRDMNLEWFYRLISQPSRIVRQTALPKFVFKVFREKVFGK